MHPGPLLRSANIWRAAYLGLAPHLHAVALRHLRCEEQARDLVHDVFLLAMQHHRLASPPATWRTLAAAQHEVDIPPDLSRFLHVLAHQRISATKRRLARRANAWAKVTNALAPPAHDHENQTVDHFARLHALARVQRAIPAPLLRAWWCRDVLDLPPATAAAHLGIEIGNLLVRAARGRARVRRFWHQQDDSDLESEMSTAD